MEITDTDLEIDDEKLMPKIAEMSGGAKKKTVKKTSKKTDKKPSKKASKKPSKKVGGAVKKTSKKTSKKVSKKANKKTSKKISRKASNKADEKANKKSSKKASNKASKKKNNETPEEEKMGGAKLNKKTSKKVKRPLPPGMLAFKEFGDFVAKELNEKNGVQLKKKAGEMWRKAKEAVKDSKNVEALLKEAKKIFNDSRK